MKRLINSTKRFNFSMSKLRDLEMRVKSKKLRLYSMKLRSSKNKRLTMHLEGKLHTGYLKIRNKLAELKQKRNRDRSSSPRRDSRVRAKAPEKQEDTDLFD
jgi:hypothetical protein